ncbi:hypothetical protein Tsp_03065 [Trichinella spiralis]|uniref:hypothetical protein n=1 Tax=Trichinella spiralis TaxID=6334 RepID=UPI0001EFB7EC|nr:hypothetical protein Tsp_03065 [Trichinella spiralis]
MFWPGRSDVPLSDDCSWIKAPTIITTYDHLQCTHSIIEHSRIYIIIHFFIFSSFEWKTTVQRRLGIARLQRTADQDGRQGPMCGALVYASCCLRVKQQQQQQQQQAALRR